MWRQYTMIHISQKQAKDEQSCKNCWETFVSNAGSLFDGLDDNYIGIRCNSKLVLTDENNVMHLAPDQW